MELEKKIIEVVRIHPLGTTDICAKCHASPTNICLGMSLKTKNGDLLAGARGKVLRSLFVSRIHPLGPVNIYTKLNGNPSNSQCRKMRSSR